MDREAYWRLNEMILGQFHMDYESKPTPVTENDILQRVADIKHREPSLDVAELLRLAREELEQASEDIAHATMLTQREQALEKLLFSHGAESISLELFLRRLLPHDTALSKREEIFKNTLESILKFARWSNGRKFEWPERNQLAALRMEHEHGALGIARTQEARFSSGVDRELARVFAPLILAYHQFESSRRMRGSKAHDSAQLRQAWSDRLKRSKLVDKPVSAESLPSGTVDPPLTDFLMVS